MSYTSIAQTATNAQLRLRIAACIAQEGGAGETLQTGALMRADQMQWQCAAEPGWGEAWESALVAGNPDPGNDPGVIPDAWILVAVQKHLGLLSEQSGT